jgi:hypothetical protein
MKEKEKTISLLMFDDSQEYDKHLAKYGIKTGHGSRAKGIKLEDGSMIIVIHRSYYLSGGIDPEQLQGIVEHERIELTSDESDPHTQAVEGEYLYILNNFGEDSLKQYHANLCNLMGGINDIRNIALTLVLNR